MFALTDGAVVDFAFEAVGLPAGVDQALRMVAMMGTVTVIGVPPRDGRVEVQLGGPDGLFSRTKTLTVTHGGDSLPQQDLRVLGELTMQGRLDMGSMITHRVGLDEIERGFELMNSGESIRTIVEMA